MKKELSAVQKQKAYDLCKKALPRVAKLPRNVKFTLGNLITDLDQIATIVISSIRRADLT